MPRPTSDVDINLAHATKSGGLAAQGTTDVALTCHVCGEAFTVTVHSLESLRTVVRPKRMVQGLTVAGVGVLFLLIALMTAQAAIVLAVVSGVIGGVALVVAAAHLAITPYFKGANTLTRASDQKALNFAGLSAHRLV